MNTVIALLFVTLSSTQYALEFLYQYIYMLATHSQPYNVTLTMSTH